MKKLYPVVHVETFSQAMDNVNLAHESGADGVFLINHSIGYDKLLHIHSTIAGAFKDFPIGINCLDLSPAEVISIVGNAAPMIWTDNALIVEGREEQPDAQAVKDLFAKAGYQGQYFGGVAFKYQKPVKDLESVTKIASQYVDVVTTSGAATGVAAPLEKLKRMKAILGEKFLAIASGITVDNVLDYTPFVDIFLVSTGISKDFLTLDAEKVKELADKIHSQ